MSDPTPPDRPRRRAASRTRKPAKPTAAAPGTKPTVVPREDSAEPKARAKAGGKRGPRTRGATLPVPANPEPTSSGSAQSAAGSAVADVSPGGTPAAVPALAARANADSAARKSADRTPVATTPVAAPTPEARIDATAGEHMLVRVPLSVRWRDLDAFNHVNNSKYLSYLEEARLRWMLGVPGMGLDEQVAPVVAASTLNYRRPISWPADIVVELFVARVGATSLTIGHRIVDSANGDSIYCDGTVVMVWIDRETGRAAPLPAGVRAACD